jgi:hypothetical protein
MLTHFQKKSDPPTYMDKYVPMEKWSYKRGELSTGEQFSSPLIRPSLLQWKWPLLREQFSSPLIRSSLLQWKWPLLREQFSSPLIRPSFLQWKWPLLREQFSNILLPQWIWNMVWLGGYCRTLKSFVHCSTCINI